MELSKLTFSPTLIDWRGAVDNSTDRSSLNPCWRAVMPDAIAPLRATKCTQVDNQHAKARLGLSKPTFLPRLIDWQGAVGNSTDRSSLNRRWRAVMPDEIAAVRATKCTQVDNQSAKSKTGKYKLTFSPCLIDWQGAVCNLIDRSSSKWRCCGLDDG